MTQSADTDTFTQPASFATDKTLPYIETPPLLDVCTRQDEEDGYKPNAAGTGNRGLKYKRGDIVYVSDSDARVGKYKLVKDYADLCPGIERRMAGTGQYGWSDNPVGWEDYTNRFSWAFIPPEKSLIPHYNTYRLYPKPTAKFQNEMMRVFHRGDVVMANGVAWRLKVDVNAYLDPPPIDKNITDDRWEYVPGTKFPEYDNTISYQVKDQVMYNGMLWRVKDATGAPGYKPPGDMNGQSNTWEYVSGAPSGTTSGGSKARKSRKARKSHSRR